MIRTPGRYITVGEAVKKLNPHIWKKLDADAMILLNEAEVVPKKKRIRQDPKPLMNQLEQEYFDTFGLKSQAEIWMIQSIRFKLGNGIWYKPDFFVTSGARNTAIEVKGPKSYRGGFENLKVAAGKYPWMKWVLVWKDSGHWREQIVLP